MTNRIYVVNGQSVTVITEQSVQSLPLKVAIDPLADNTSDSSTPTFTLTASTSVVSAY
jgi:hypothetical protein